jgi:hypothetical protein
MEAETSRMPEKHANDAPPKESPPPAILRPAPAPPNAEGGSIEKSRSQKRHRRKYEYWERVQTATTRKLGACTECRRKKYRVCSILPLKNVDIDLSSVTTGQSSRQRTSPAPEELRQLRQLCRDQNHRTLGVLWHLVSLVNPPTLETASERQVSTLFHQLA